MYTIKNIKFSVFAVFCLFIVRVNAAQYLVVNKHSGAEVNVQFAPEKGSSYYTNAGSVQPKETKTFDIQFSAQVIKLFTNTTSPMGRCAAYVYPNSSCSKLTIYIEDINSDLKVTSECG